VTAKRGVISGGPRAGHAYTVEANAFLGLKSWNGCLVITVDNHLYHPARGLQRRTWQTGWDGGGRQGAGKKEVEKKKENAVPDSPVSTIVVETERPHQVEGITFS